MELTIEQALQQGIAAHKEGKLEEAERLYRAILQSQPLHPDANHNLGILAVSVNQADVALPLFKTALEANPKIEQFWLSCIDALIKEQQFEAAKQVLEQGKKQGMVGEKLDAFESQLVSKTQTVNFANPTQQQLNSLLEYYQTERYADAERLAVSITQEFPEHQFGWKVLGALLQLTGRVPESLFAKQKAVELASLDAEAHNNLGNTLQELGRLEEAETSYRQAIALKPDYVDAHSNLGITLKELGRLEESEAIYTEAIALKPNYADAHNNLGNTLKELGRLDEAERSYRQAIALKPDYADAHYNLGATFLELGILDNAEASYRQAIALKPDYADAHINLGITLKELGRLEEAEAIYTQAIALKPEYADAYNNLGNTLQELGRLEEAETSYIQAIALKPGYADAHYNLGATLRGLGRLDEAEASYKQAITLKFDYAEARSNLGVILQELGRLEEAEASYTQAIALKPNYAEAHNNLGNTLRELGKLNEAETSLRKAIALKPEYVEAHGNLGNTLEELGRLEEAEASYLQAIALNPDYADAKHMLAALSGETTATAPLDYVEGLFDNYAAKFESSLIENLEYKIPRVIAEIIIKDSKFNLLGSIMDLGCGTGLFGAEINQFCEHLEGIDLSEKMLDKAKGKNIYNKLIKHDIIGYLSNASLNFDYFISTDVFVYIGDLSDVFRLIKSRNRTGGKLAFSTEDHDGDGFFLEQSGRYSHSKKYIESLCKKFGYELRHFETQALRKEKNRYISGGLYLLDF
jgi:predicted TPR repeat methyltransferase